MSNINNSSVDLPNPRLKLLTLSAKRESRVGKSTHKHLHCNEICLWSGTVKESQETCKSKVNVILLRLFFEV